MFKSTYICFFVLSIVTRLNCFNFISKNNDYEFTLNCSSTFPTDDWDHEISGDFIVLWGNTDRNPCKLKIFNSNFILNSEFDDINIDSSIGKSAIDIINKRITGISEDGNLTTYYLNGTLFNSVPFKTPFDGVWFNPYYDLWSGDLYSLYKDTDESNFVLLRINYVTGDVYPYELHTMYCGFENARFILNDIYYYIENCGSYRKLHGIYLNSGNTQHVYAPNSKIASIVYDYIDDDFYITQSDELNLWQFHNWDEDISSVFNTSNIHGSTQRPNNQFDFHLKKLLWTDPTNTNNILLLDLSGNIINNFTIFDGNSADSEMYFLPPVTCCVSSFETYPEHIHIKPCFEPDTGVTSTTYIEVTGVSSDETTTASETTTTEDSDTTTGESSTDDSDPINQIIIEGKNNSHIILVVNSSIIMKRDSLLTIETNLTLSPESVLVFEDVSNKNYVTLVDVNGCVIFSGTLEITLSDETNPSDLIEPIQLIKYNCYEGEFSSINIPGIDRSCIHPKYSPIDFSLRVA